MPGFLVHVGAKVTCSHGGQAQPTVPNPRVTVSGLPTVLITSPNGPCVSAQWLTGTTRVLSNGQPLVVQSSQATCAPTGTPLIIPVTQIRVSAI
jgi:hypothetical protein